MANCRQTLTAGKNGYYRQYKAAPVFLRG